MGGTNIGLISIRSTPWILNTFFPLWRSYQKLWAEKQLTYATQDQLAFTQTLLQCIIRRPISIIDEKIWNQAAKYYADKPEEPTDPWNIAGLLYHHKKFTQIWQSPLNFKTFALRAYMTSHFLYSTRNRINTSQSFGSISNLQPEVVRIDENNAVCFLGLDGLQINHHEMFPPWMEHHVKSEPEIKWSKVWRTVNISQHSLLVHAKFKDASCNLSVSDICDRHCDTAITSIKPHRVLSPYQLGG